MLGRRVACNRELRRRGATALSQLRLSLRARSIATNGTDSSPSDAAAAPAPGTGDDEAGEDLARFLAQGYDENTAFFRGALFEYQTVVCLASVCMRLRRCGSAGDAGIDLEGDWLLPDTLAVPVVVQCKNEAKPLAPRHMREFIGAVEQRSLGTLGVLACATPPSAASHRALHESSRPLLAVRLTAQQQQQQQQLEEGGEQLQRSRHGGARALRIHAVWLNSAAHAMLPDLRVAHVAVPRAWTRTPAGPELRHRHAAAAPGRVVMYYAGHRLKP